MKRPPALNQKQIALRLRQLANRTHRLVVALGSHGREMMGAAIIARQWSAQIEKQLEASKVESNESQSPVAR